jgi:hypothetical protein
VGWDCHSGGGEDRLVMAAAADDAGAASWLECAPGVACWLTVSWRCFVSR